jgi:hypothetical protein
MPAPIPCFRLRGLEPDPEVKPTGRHKQWWDERCNRILRLHARLSNAEVADRIAAETGLRFSTFAVSRYRTALGLDRFRGNDWTAPLRRWQPWQGRDRG